MANSSHATRFAREWRNADGDITARYAFNRSAKAQARRGRMSGLVRAEAATQRARRVQFFSRSGATVPELMARFGISRRTVFYDLKRTVTLPEWSPDLPLPIRNVPMPGVPIWADIPPECTCCPSGFPGGVQGTSFKRQKGFN